ncbi:DUF3054 domain-containing protein [Halovivax limisalsi]|uniref:DUF3054 domain-containing protein n=1 Tax=Halovivax limisalsi TaxID=1453760 RepID=UPI001FFDCFCC|nr:DUF3054 domain-containing protein [Halovivax limisalsi]
MGTRTSAGSVARWGPVLLLDCIAIVGLVVVGQQTHGGDPFGNLLRTGETVAPFLLGWLTISVLGGLYPNPPAGAVDRLRLLVVCWFAAANVGFLLRGSPPLPGGVPWEFTAVFTGFGAIILVGVHAGDVLVRAYRHRVGATTP